MRVFVIPITRTQWALHCHPTNSVPTRLTRWAGTAYEKWSKWSEYPRSSWRGKIYAYGESLMDKIDFREYFLKEIPSKSEAGTVTAMGVVAPDIVSRSEIIHELKALAITQAPYHSKWMKYCCYLLPVSSLFTLVPIVPNFPLFYNMFRVYSHYKARHGAQHLLHFLESGEYEVHHDAELSRWYAGVGGGSAVTGSEPLAGTPDSRTVVSGSSESVDGYAEDSSAGQSDNSEFYRQTMDSNCRLLEEDPPLVSDNDIAQMAKYLKLPAFEAAIRRARHQIIAQNSKPIK
ncbi:hypothetical protein FB645_005663 [Coemansia sp. IMI 203386]|nr:hypothetical protein FB645_005663 [Coemansia sp. IMI 203386]